MHKYDHRMFVALGRPSVLKPSRQGRMLLSAFRSPFSFCALPISSGIVALFTSSSSSVELRSNSKSSNFAHVYASSSSPASLSLRCLTSNKQLVFPLYTGRVIPNSRSKSTFECNAMPLADHSSLGVAPLPEEDEISNQLPLDDNAGTPIDSEIFEAREDRYDGVIVDPDSLPADVPIFVSQLKQSLTAWEKKGKKGVWLKLPTGKANLVPSAIEAGFKYHHAEPTYLMLTHWLPESPSTLPANASHQVGIGAFVLNEKNEVLAVQEKNGPLKGTGVWKMPTGLINQAEDIFAGAVREVKEETGVDTEFLEVLGFRQGHHVAFEKSDLFFLCILRPLSSEITIQVSEIEAAKWMPLEEFGAQEFFQGRSMLKKMLDLCIARRAGEYRGFSPREMHSGFQKKTSYFYYNVGELG